MAYTDFIAAIDLGSSHMVGMVGAKGPAGTLSIIAYKQPVTKMEIEKIRGVSCEHAVNRLLDFELITEVGRKDAPGRPILFGTTEQFLRSFGVKSLTELPELNPDRMAQFREEAEKEVQLKLDI